MVYDELCTRVIYQRVPCSFSLSELFVIRTIGGGCSGPVKTTFLGGFALPFHPSRCLARVNRFLCACCYAVPGLGGNVSLTCRLAGPLRTKVSVTTLLLSLGQCRGSNDRLGRLRVLRSCYRRIVGGHRLTRRGRLQVDANQDANQGLFSGLQIWGRFGMGPGGAVLEGGRPL